MRIKTCRCKSKPHKGRPKSKSFAKRIEERCKHRSHVPTVKDLERKGLVEPYTPFRRLFGKKK